MKTGQDDSDDTPPPSAVSEATNLNWTQQDSSIITGQLDRLQEKQRAAVKRAKMKSKASDQGHPDLQDLNFDNPDLPPPLSPTRAGADNSARFDKGSLSDFSDYDSSADEAPRASTSSARPSTDYRKHDDEDYGQWDTKKNLLDDEDPFADPFADDGDVTTPGIPEKRQHKW